MYIMDTRRIRKRMQSLLRKTSINIALWNLFENAFRRDFYVPEELPLDMFFEEVKDGWPEIAENMSDDEMLLAAVLLTALHEQLQDMGMDMEDMIENLGGIDAIPLDETIEKMIPVGHVYRAQDFQQDAYLQTVHLEEAAAGPYTLGIRFYHKNALTDDQPPTLDDAGFLVPHPAVFADPMHLPCIRDDDNIICSLLAPYGIHLSQPIIDTAKGTVLLLGAELGYTAFHIAQKESVTHITVVEPDPDLCRLFSEKILPQFPHKEKITIINTDPFSYFAQMKDGAFDIAAVVDFASDLDLFHYLRYKKSAQRLQKTTFLHRGEDAFQYELYMQMFHHLMSTYDPETYAAEPDDEEASAASFAFLQNLTKDIRVTDARQIDELLTLDGILKLMAN